MARTKKAAFFCSSCGHEEARWFGRCPACQAWNSALEAPAAPARAPGGRRGSVRWGPPGAAPAGAHPLATVDIAAEERRPTGTAELDRVLGGG